MTETVAFPLPGSVVVGVDGSPGSERALAWAVEDAHAEGRALTVLHSGAQSVLRNTVLLDGQGIDHTELYRELRLADIALLERAVAAATETYPDLRVEAVLVETDIRTALVDASRHAHLVVVGSRGRGTVASVLLGSVSRYVAAHALCPVVVSREPWDEDARDLPHGVRGVVVGVDWTAGSTQVAEYAFRLASVRGLPVTVVHALWHVPSEWAERPLVTVGDIEGLGPLLAETVGGLREKYPDVPVYFELRRGLADEVLARAAGRGSIVVVGRPPHDLLTKLLEGTTAIAVVEQSRGTVVVVPEPVRQ
jgi:nucleotide-binding universal stress UspA family protein